MKKQVKEVCKRAVAVIDETIVNGIERGRKQAKETFDFGRNVFAFVMVVGFIGMVDQYCRAESGPGRDDELVPKLAEVRGSLNPVINQVAEEEDLPPLLLRAMADIENGPKNDHLTCRRRHEPGWMREARRIAKPGTPERDIEAMSSSVGPMQVIYALHFEKCGLSSWRQLCEPETAVRCGATVLKHEIRRRVRSSLSARQLIVESLRGYNGVDAAVPYEYSDRVIARYEELVRRSKVASLPARSGIPS